MLSRRRIGRVTRRRLAGVWRNDAIRRHGSARAQALCGLTPGGVRAKNLGYTMGTWPAMTRRMLLVETPKSSAHSLAERPSARRRTTSAR